MHPEVGNFPLLLIEFAGVKVWKRYVNVWYPPSSEPFFTSTIFVLSLLLKLLIYL